ncbi:MAG: copper homeostasis protein CutC [Bacteroidetes bacterium]|nr:copper homeostasis protein CutC [Bacteroidota bacterium]
MKKILEIAVFSVEGAMIAADAGADRVELCSSYLEGGLTPSFGTIAHVCKFAGVPVHVMIRPRGGNFIYSPIEIQTMSNDIALCKELGASGVVFGCLIGENKIAEENIQRLKETASAMEITFHRAFDLAENKKEALEILIQCGIQRVLTSGGKINALEGAGIIAELNLFSEEKIILMPGGGINAENARQIAEETGCSEFHSSAKAISSNGIPFDFGKDVLPDRNIIAGLKRALG